MPRYSQINPNRNRTWWEWLTQGAFGKDEMIHQLEPYTEQQTGAMDFLLNNGQQQIQNPYQGFDPIKQDTLRTFFEDIVPQLQSRFNALGDNSATSPILRTQLSSAGAGLAQRLASMQSMYGQQAQQNALQQIQTGLNPRSQFLQSGSTPGVIQNLIGGVSPGIGYGVGKAIANKFIE